MGTKNQSQGTCGLVAMTSAPHAEGRQLDPCQVYHFGRAHLQLTKSSSSIPVAQVMELRKDRYASRWCGPVEHCRALPARRAANRILMSTIGAMTLRRQAVIPCTRSPWKRWGVVCTEVLHCWQESFFALRLRVLCPPLTYPLAELRAFSRCVLLHPFRPAMKYKKLWATKAAQQQDPHGFIRQQDCHGSRRRPCSSIVTARSCAALSALPPDSH